MWGYPGPSGVPLSTTAVPGSPVAAMPPVMTPAQAANVMQVAEEDVLEAILTGSLKAKKIGNSYRITAKQLQRFLDDDE